jgi:hypothetical protein
MKKLLFYGLVAGTAYVAYVQWPEFRRYMKIRSMAA